MLLGLRPGSRSSFARHFEFFRGGKPGWGTCEVVLSPRPLDMEWIYHHKTGDGDCCAEALSEGSR